MRFYLFGPRIGGRWGVRPGISLNPADFIPKATAAINTDPDSFVYVIEDTRGYVKIGTSKNPLARMATLRAGSASPLKFAYIAVTPDNDGYDIEREAHKALRAHRVEGEWFDVPPEMAVAALSGAAFKLDHPLAQLTEDQTRRTLQISHSSEIPVNEPSFLKTFMKGGLLGAAGIALLIFWLVYHIPD